MPSKSSSCSRTSNQRGYVRPKGAAEHTGLCLRTVYKIVAEGKVKSKLVRLEGSGRGCRLISLRSLEEYIASF
jgi:hypothetical protein